MDGHASWKARELEILQLLAQGLTNGEIGARLYLADNTVRWYNKRIFAKLGVSNRLQAVNRATELGLLGDSGRPPPSRPIPTTHRSPVQYVANGDIHIAYQVVGDGPIDLLFIHGFISHLELAWENAEFARFFEQLGSTARIILFDKRGVGLSDRIQGAPSLENTIEDARCVLDAVNSEQAFVMGTSEGGAAAVLLAATYPERVRGLILYAVVPKVVQTDGEPEWAAPAAQFERLIDRMQRTWGGPWAIEQFAPSRAHDESFRAWWAMVLRAASSPSSVRAVLELVADVDIRPLLPQVGVRTMVIHKSGDQIVSVAAGRYIARLIPGAIWVELPGSDHIYFVDSAGILAAIAAFCQEAGTGHSADSWLAIILYALTGEAGVTAQSLRAPLSSFAPRHVIDTGRGVIALFDSPRRAIHCATGLRSRVEATAVKISLHVGACQVSNGQPLASVLRVAEEAAEQARPGEIVVTQTLHDTLAGAGFRFATREEGPASESRSATPTLTLL